MFFFENLFILIFSGFLIICSTLSLSTRNIIHAILYLILSFLAVVFILFLIECDFIAFIFLLIYIGAIAILFLFSVMLLNIKIVNSLKELFYFFPFSCFVGIFLFLQLFIHFGTRFETTIYSETNEFLDIMYFNWFESIEICFNVKTFGLILYSYYFIQILLVGFILLLAIIGTVVLTFEKTALKKKDRNQFLFKQITRTV